MCSFHGFRDFLLPFLARNELLFIEPRVIALGEELVVEVTDRGLVA